MNILLAIPYLLYYFVKDTITKSKRSFYVLYGVAVYVGEVGSGKTLGMVERAIRLKKKDPNIQVWANFPCPVADYEFDDIEELADVPSYTVVLLSEGAIKFNSRDWSRFPVSMVELLTQNRKWGTTNSDGSERPPGVLMLIDVQNADMIDTTIRRLANTIVHCNAFCSFGNGPRLMWQKHYSPGVYLAMSEINKKRRARTVYGYIATDLLRRQYDTYFQVHGKDKS